MNQHNGLIAWLALLISIGSLAFSGLQWWEAHEARLHNAAARVERALIRATQAESASALASDREFEVNTSLTNFGRTPALDLKYEGSVMLSATENSAPPAYTRQSVYAAFVPAGSAYKGGLTAERPFTDIELSEVAQGKKYIFVYGVTTYRDVFGNENRSSWCFWYVHSSNTFSSCHYNNTSE